MAAKTGREDVKAFVELTLRSMGEGGIYDQLGGGFHRYTVDGAWLVPHFEKCSTTTRCSSACTWRPFN
jgi:uncharacterized protein YyaL (SSP411 family)